MNGSLTVADLDSMSSNWLSADMVVDSTSIVLKVGVDSKGDLHWSTSHDCLICSSRKQEGSEVGVQKQSMLQRKSLQIHCSDTTERSRGLSSLAKCIFVS